MISVILCGGSGSRLWPLSGEKPFYPFFNGHSLLEISLKRLESFQPFILIGTKEQEFVLSDFLKKLPYKVEAIYEPESKNTASAIALACSYLESSGRAEEVIGIFPSDHFIKKEDIFHQALKAGLSLAQEKKSLVALAAPPTKPHSGYGYIKLGESFSKTVSPTGLKNKKAVQTFKASGFVEKPSLSLATGFIKEGSYVWNAGIFLCRVDVLIKLFERYLPKLWGQIRSIKKDFSHIASVYKSLDSLSFDKGLMEKADLFYGVLCNMGWLDLGSWDAISSLEPKDIYEQGDIKKRDRLALLGSSLDPKDITKAPVAGGDKTPVFHREDKKSGRLFCPRASLSRPEPKKKSLEDSFSSSSLSQPEPMGKAPVVLKDSENNFVFSSVDQPIALIGLKDSLVVQGERGLLIAKKGKSELVGEALKNFYTNKKETLKGSFKKPLGQKEIFKGMFKKPLSQKETLKGMFKKLLGRKETLKGSFKKPLGQKETLKPWGMFKTFYEREDLKCKIIKVHPQKRLSLQSHQHRAEHWIVKRGEAFVYLAGRSFKLKEGEHVFIPPGAPHRLENKGPSPLEVLEISIGDYLGEDDIVRYEDDYGRS